MATYREGPYVVEEGYAIVDEDGEVAHQRTFADTVEQAARLLLEDLGFNRHEADRELVILRREDGSEVAPFSAIGVDPRS